MPTFIVERNCCTSRAKAEQVRTNWKEYDAKVKDA